MPSPGTAAASEQNSQNSVHMSVHAGCERQAKRNSRESDGKAGVSRGCDQGGFEVQSGQVTRISRTSGHIGKLRCE